MQATNLTCWAPSTECDRVMLGLSRTIRELKGISDNAGLDFGAAAVMFSVAHHPDGIRISDLAERVRLDLSTVSRHVRGLEESGLLERQSDPDDRRASLVRITEAGKDTFQVLMQRRSEIFAAACADWPESDVATLASLLERLADRLPTAIHQGANA